MKIQVTIVYFFSAVAKITPQYLAGEILTRSLKQEGWLAVPESWRTPAAMSLLAVTSIVAELFIAFGLWSPRLRLFAIIAGTGFHLLIIAVLDSSRLSLAIFALDMFAVYVLFADAKSKQLRRSERRSGAVLDREAGCRPRRPSFRVLVRGAGFDRLKEGGRFQHVDGDGDFRSDERFLRGGFGGLRCYGIRVLDSINHLIQSPGSKSTESSMRFNRGQRMPWSVQLLFLRQQPERPGHVVHELQTPAALETRGRLHPSGSASGAGSSTWRPRCAGREG